MASTPVRRATRSSTGSAASKQTPKAINKGSAAKVIAGSGKKTPRKKTATDEGDEGSVSSSSTRNRLPKWIEKQLAEDIEASKGIKGFDAGKTQGIRELCDYRTYTLQEPEVYGTNGSEQRRKIAQKVNKWKTLPEAEYLKKLIDLEVTPYKQRSKKGTSKSSSKKGKPKEAPPESIEAQVDNVSLDLSCLSIEEEELLEEPEVEHPLPKQKVSVVAAKKPIGNMALNTRELSFFLVLNCWIFPHQFLPCSTSFRGPEGH